MEPLKKVNVDGTCPVCSGDSFMLAQDSTDYSTVERVDGRFVATYSHNEVDDHRFFA